MCPCARILFGRVARIREILHTQLRLTDHQIGLYNQHIVSLSQQKSEWILREVPINDIFEDLIQKRDTFIEQVERILEEIHLEFKIKIPIYMLQSPLQEVMDFIRENV